MGFLKKFLGAVTDEAGMTDTGATDRALNRQAEATERANQRLEQQYRESKERYKPYQEEGLRSFKDMADYSRDDATYQMREEDFAPEDTAFTMKDFKEDPGYQFRMAEGMKAIERSSSAGGGRNSGKTMKEMMRYGQGLASEEYGKAYGRFDRDYGRYKQDSGDFYNREQDAYNRFNQDRANKFNRMGTIANYGAGANDAITGVGSSTAKGVSANRVGMGNAYASAEMHRGDETKDIWKQGAKTAGMMCWVARAIFGEKNPKWKHARYYIINIGPKWFKKLYRERGEQFSKKVEKSLFLRLTLRPLFEYFAFRGKIEAKHKVFEKMGASYAG